MQKEIPSILQKIVSRKKEEVEYIYRLRLDKGYISKIKDLPPTYDFHLELAHKRQVGLNLIAEVKLASPSNGDIRPGADPIEIAKLYNNSGVSAISVLTDLDFKGHIDYLREINKVTQVPLLRKDFIIDEVQITQSRVYGADAILLISAILEESQLRDYIGIAKDLGMSCLVESHNESELEKAVNAKTKIFGINNRNLNTFEVDLGTTGKLKKFVPKGYPIVTESGINNFSDVKRLAIHGVNSMLVGEAIMSQRENPKEEDMKNKINELLGEI